ncbi:MAG: Fic family protein [Elusimicrobia bacterium]|nr:Fic family protein [Elusimicrobiota bacterium]
MVEQKSGITRAGRWERQQGPEPYRCFYPAPLPPDPPVMLSESLHLALDRATKSLARLDGMARVLPNPGLFLYSYIRKEAVLSSQIEGTQSSLSDLLLYESKQATGVPLSDVKEVSNYVAAMEYGLKRLAEGFPLSSRLIKEVHAVLLRGTRGENKRPGEFRTSQNWIGGTRPGNAVYVPPPPRAAVSAIGALEKFIHGEPVQTPTLIKTGLVHAQFESIHPFLDGNGRVGRLLIPLMLYAEDALAYPLLYLSLYLKQRRTDYYDALTLIRTHGRWEEWLAFYLAGVEEVAREANESSGKLLKIFAADRQKAETLGKGASSALKIHALLEKHCLVSLAFTCDKVGLSLPTAIEAMARLQKLGIVKEISGRRRKQIFVYQAHWKLITQGMGQDRSGEVGSDRPQSV